MQAVIYADMLFLVNLIMDAFILFVTGRIMRKRLSMLRLLAGATLSALLYCLFALIAPEIALLQLSAPLLIIAAGTAAAFLPQRPAEYVRLTITAILITFATGGGIMALIFITSQRANSPPKILSFKMLIVSTIVFYIAFKLISRRIQRGALSKQAYVELIIHMNGKSARLNGLLDTGSTLCDPIGQAPVILAEFREIRRLLPESAADAYENRVGGDFGRLAEAFSEAGMDRRVRVIPYTAIGVQNAMLIGFRPDSVEFMDGSKLRHVVNNVVIGISDNISPAGEYGALVNPAAIRGI